MKQTPMRIARCVGNRKLIFAMIQSNAAHTTHLKQIGNANPSTIVNERNQEAHSRPRGKA